MFFNISLDERVEKAKKDQEELNKLIEDYKPFIASVLHKKTGKFFEYGYDDELTVGMMAFKEAIEAYDKSKGKFLTFAKHVIILRNIDHYRKSEKLKDRLCLQEISAGEDETESNAMTSKAIEEYENNKENELRKLEILEYKKELKKWGIEFSELVQVSPKQENLKRLYKDVAQFIVAEPEVLNRLIQVKRLPIKEIQRNMFIHRKKIERGRLYIIALVIVLIGEYEVIKEYIN